jgi:hypothetical protein
VHKRWPFLFNRRNGGFERKAPGSQILPVQQILRHAQDDKMDWDGRFFTQRPSNYYHDQSLKTQLIIDIHQQKLFRPQLP